MANNWDFLKHTNCAQIVLFCAQHDTTQHIGKKVLVLELCLPPIPNEKFVFFQLRERVASTYLKSLLTMSSQMNDQAVYTFNKTMSVTANQEILKDYVKAQQFVERNLVW